MRIKLKFRIIMCLCIFLGSCATTTQYAKFAGKEKLQSATTAKIYVLRPSMFGSAVKMKVFCNDKLMGKTGPKSYLSWEVPEGEHIIKSNSENKDYFTVNAKAGKTYYIHQNPKIGFVLVRSSLELLSENEGESVLAKLKQPKLKYAE